MSLLNKGLRTLHKKEAKMMVDVFHVNYSHNLKNPFFIIGCGRSGTTILTKILRTNPNVCSYSEANEIWDPIGYPWENSKLKRPPIWYDGVEYTEKWREYFDDSYKTRLKNIFGAYQKFSKSGYFLNKSPMNTFRVPEIIEMFPGCKIIHMVRDGRAVTYSWSKKQSKKISQNQNIYRDEGYYFTFDQLLEYIAKSWVIHLREIDDKVDRYNLRGDRFIEIKYEDLMDDPQKTLDKISRFVGFSNVWVGNFDLDKLENRNYKWENNLNETQRRKINNIIYGTLKNKGYSTS